MSHGGSTIALSLVSHTNLGKTTLARTLLRRDVGEVLDQAHVTVENVEYELVTGSDGSRLVLWDTPGFGNSRKLLQRLEKENRPITSLLLESWDRMTNLPFWCTQEAVRNVRERADVVLYLVNATEDPASAGYLEPELRILNWAAKPVIVLLNQTGDYGDHARRRETEETWKKHLAGENVVRDVLSLDAFTRCWVEEGVLLEHVRDVLPEDRQEVMERLVAAWREQNLTVFARAIERMAAAVGRAAAEREVPAPGLFGGSGIRQAVDALSWRMRREIRSATADLIELHGLDGEVAEELGHRLEDVSAPDEPQNPWTNSVVGGVVGGLVGGLAADVASAGMTFGGGAVLGAILGAMGLGGLTWAYETIGGGQEPVVRWSPQFLERQVREGLLRYFAIAHFGRGAGRFHERDHPDFWREAVDRHVGEWRPFLESIFTAARSRDVETGAREAAAALVPVLEAIARDVLVALYPGSVRSLPQERSPSATPR